MFGLHCQVQLGKIPLVTPEMKSFLRIPGALSHPMYVWKPIDAQPLSIFIPRHHMLKNLTTVLISSACDPKDPHPGSHTLAPLICQDIRSLSKEQIRNVPGEAKRTKRFLGLVASAIAVGLAGSALIDAENVRSELRSRLGPLAQDIHRLDTGVHAIEGTILHHIKLDSEWKSQMANSLGEFGKNQIKLTNWIRTSHQQIQKQFQVLDSALHQMESDIGHVIQHLASNVLFNDIILASYIDSLEEIIDDIIWTSLSDGKFSAWMSKVEGLDVPIWNLIRSTYPHSNITYARLVLKLVYNSEWSIFHKTPTGTTIMNLIPTPESICILHQIRPPNICILGDSDEAFIISIGESFFELESHQSKKFLRESYKTSCDTHVFPGCGSPENYELTGKKLACAQQLATHESPTSCEVTIKRVQSRYLIYPNEDGIYASGELLVQVGPRGDMQKIIQGYFIPRFTTVSTTLYDLNHKVVYYQRASKRIEKLPGMEFVFWRNWSYRLHTDLDFMLHNETPKIDIKRIFFHGNELVDNQVFYRDLLIPPAEPPYSWEKATTSASTAALWIISIGNTMACCLLGWVRIKKQMLKCRKSENTPVVIGGERLELQGKRPVNLGGNQLMARPEDAF